MLRRLLLGWCWCVVRAAACTYFETPGREVAGDGPYVVARTMEFFSLGPTNWTAALHPEGSTWNSAAIGHPLSAEVVVHGHVSVDFAVPAWTGLAIPVDGMNVKGLCCSLLLFRTMVLPLPANVTGKLFYAHFCRWALSRYTNTSAVLEALQQTEFVDQSFAGVLATEALSFHVALTDRSGHSVVLEWLGEQRNFAPTVTPNWARTLTNDPAYPWHVKNLDNYAFLTWDERTMGARTEPFRRTTDLRRPYHEVPAVVGSGFNLRGLPGDTTPASRFVRAFYLSQIAQYNNPPKSQQDHLVLAQAVLNNVFIPKGAEGFNLLAEDYTQWAMLKLPRQGAQGTIYMRSYTDMLWRSIDLKEARLDKPGNVTDTFIDQNRFRSRNWLLDFFKPESVGRCRP